MIVAIIAVAVAIAVSVSVAVAAVGAVPHSGIDVILLGESSEMDGRSVGEIRGRWSHEAGEGCCLQVQVSCQVGGAGIGAEDDGCRG